MPARLADTMPPMLVARLIGPEIARIVLHRGDNVGGRMRFETVGELGQDALPLVGRLAKRGQDRVVEIEQDGGREIGHQRSMEITADNNLPGNAGTAPIDLSGLVRLKYFDQRDYGDAARAPRGNKTAEHRPITPGREGEPMMQKKIPSHYPTRHAGAEIQCRLGKGS